MGTVNWSDVLRRLVLTGTAVVAATSLVAFTVGRDHSQDDQILRGRALVLSHACSACHSGVFDPGGEGYLAGARSAAEEFRFDRFTMRAPNLTPDMETGIGRYSDRQVFNALRFGLRLRDGPDLLITS